MARDITFRFRAQGLNDVRNQIATTANFIKRIREELTKSNSNPAQRFRVGSEFSRLDKVLQSSVRRYDELTQALDRTYAAQKRLKEQQDSARAAGRPIPNQLRGPDGRFTGQTQQSLEAQAQDLINQRNALDARTAETVLRIRERTLAVMREQADTQEVIRQLLRESQFGQTKQAVQDAAGGIEAAVEARISALQAAINQGSAVLANVRQQLRRDYPKGTGDAAFTEFEKAERQVAALNNALDVNQSKIDKLRQSGRGARSSVIRQTLGLDSPGARGVEQEVVAEDVERQKELVRLQAERRRLINDQTRALQRQANAANALTRLQEGQFLPGIQVGGIEELVNTQVRAAEEIANLESRGFVDELEKNLPGVKDQFAEVRQAAIELNRALEQALGPDFVEDLDTATKNAQELTEQLREARAAGDLEAEAQLLPQARDASQRLNDLQQQYAETIIDNPEIQKRADVAYEAINGLQNRLESDFGEGIPLIPKESDLIGQLSGLDKILFETFSGLKRRFITTFQFILSGSIIFGIQRVAREFVQAAIEVERTFLDIQSILDSTGASVQNFEQSVRLESLRQNVLAVANEFNVLPAEANQAAYQMVARFQSVEAALIATRAQLLATKVSTAEQAEVLRALTATADVFAQNIDTGTTALERQTEHARIYMQVLDGATVLQQRFGIAIEDTIEGSAQLAEVFQQLGFELSEVQAAIGLVSRQTGTTGQVTADRLSRSIATIGTPEVRSQLLRLAAGDPNFTLSLEDFISEKGGAEAIREIDRQFANLNTNTQNRIREIIGGRREAAFVAAFFGTASERAAAVRSIESDVGAAADRFNTLRTSVAERIQGVIAQFQSLAQNLSQIGFLTPLKGLLILLESILSVVNSMISAVGTLVKSLNAIRIPGLPAELSGMGDLLITITSMAFVAQTLGNSLTRVGSAVLTFARDSQFADFFNKVQAIQRGLVLQQAIPTSSVGGFASTFLGGNRRPGLRGALLDAGPIGVSRRGISALGQGLRNFTSSLKAAGAETVVVGAAETGLTGARTANAAATAQATAATTANTAGMRAAAGSLLLTAGKFAAIVAAIAVGAQVLSRINPLREGGLFDSETIVDRRLRLANEGQGTSDETQQQFRTLERISNEKISEAEAVIAQLEDEFFSDSGLVGNILDSVVNNISRVGSPFRLVGGLNKATRNIPGLPETNTRDAADTVGKIYEGYLEQRAFEIQEALNRGTLDGINAVNAVNLLQGIQREAGTFDVGSQAFEDLFQGFVDEAAGELYTGPGGVLSRFVKERVFSQDLAGDEGVRALALAKLEQYLADQQSRFEELFNQLELNAGLELEFLDAAGYTEELNELQSLFQAGEKNRSEFDKRINELSESAQIALQIATDEGNTEEITALEEFLRTLGAAYVTQKQAEIDSIASTGNTVNDTGAQLQATIEAYADQVAKIAEGSPLGNERFAEQLRNSIRDLRQQQRTAAFDRDINFLNTQVSAVGANVIAQYDLMKRLRDRVLDEFENITGNRNLQTVSPYTGAFADELNNLQTQFINFTTQLRDLSLAKATLEEEIARSAAVLRGDTLAINAARASALRGAIADLRAVGRDEEAFILQKELANIERANLAEINRRTEIRVQANVRLGDELAAGRAAIDIAKAAYEATKRANVIEEEKIAALDRLRRAEFEYFQKVLEYSALLKTADIDLTDPVETARAEAEIAAERYANAVGALEKEQARQDLERANAASQQAFYDDRLSELRFLFESDQIGKGAYIDALRRLQAGVDRSTYQGEQIWRDIELTILGLVDQVEQGFNIPAEIRLPTLFEVRRAVQAEEMGVNYLDNREQEINIFVSNELDLSEAMRIIGETVDVDSARIAPGGAGITLGVT